MKLFLSIFINTMSYTDTPENNKLYFCYFCLFIPHYRILQIFDMVNTRQKRLAKQLHHEMIHKLSNHLSPSVGQYWDSFLNLMKPFIPHAELNTCLNLSQIFDKLTEKGEISLGNYTIILDAINVINHQQCNTLVHEYSEQIKVASTSTKYDSQPTTGQSGSNSEPIAGSSGTITNDAIRSQSKGQGKFSFKCTTLLYSTISLLYIYVVILYSLSCQ